MLKPDQITSSLSPDIKTIIVAYSGGIDSHVLLHILASNSELKAKIMAVYIHHGIQAEADAWEEHCQTVALDLEVDFKTIKVTVNNVSGQSLEELARDARYKALKPLLGADDTVLLAQHREDQLETVLLQLFRGAGVQGLSGMPAIIHFGKGSMCRPLLDVSKQEIKDYAIANNLFWIEDPSNNSNDFDRNFLRNQIVPKLKQKWPALDKTVARSARHCANAQQLAERLAIDVFSKIFNETDNTLNISKTLEYDSHMQSLCLRQWFKLNQLRMPAENTLYRIMHEVVNASESRNPEIRGQGYCIRRYRNKLFILKSEEVFQPLSEKNWTSAKKKITLSHGISLNVAESDEGIAKTKWESAEVTIKFRQGAEKIRLPGREGRHTLKKLYQEQGIPPWQRPNIPLIYLDDQLAAVANLWVSADFFSAAIEPCYKIEYKIID